MKNAKLYTNENFRQPLVRELRELGYDVLTSREANQDNQGITDSEVLRFAISQNRALITYNRKDFLKLHKETKKHRGIILCKEDRNDAEYARIIHEQLLKFESLNNQLILIKKSVK